MDSALLEKSVEHTIEKLNKLKINEELASELKWCLGSYRFDHNPDGLKMKSMLALELLKEAKSKSSRSVSKKLIADLEKAIVN